MLLGLPKRYAIKVQLQLQKGDIRPWSHSFLHQPERTNIWERRGQQSSEKNAAEFQPSRAQCHHMFCPVGALLHTSRRKQVGG